jgi:hypothetical protein
VIRHGVTPAVLAAATAGLIVVMLRARRPVGPDAAGTAIVDPAAEARRARARGVIR